MAEFEAALYGFLMGVSAVGALVLQYMPRPRMEIVVIESEPEVILVPFLVSEPQQPPDEAVQEAQEQQEEGEQDDNPFRLHEDGDGSRHCNSPVLGLSELSDTADGE